MRRVHTLAVSLFGAVIAIACGGTSSSNNPPGGITDAGGTDGTVNSNNGPDGSNGGDDGSILSTDSGVCVFPDADINSLDPADAALNDAGATVGLCIGCAKTSCAPKITACNADCTCSSSFECVFKCIGGVGNTLTSCASLCNISLGGGNAAELGLLLCAAQSCGTACGVSFGGGGHHDGGHGGGQDSGDDGGSAADATDQ